MNSAETKEEIKEELKFVDKWIGEDFKHGKIYREYLDKINKDLKK